MVLQNLNRNKKITNNNDTKRIISKNNKLHNERW